MPAVKSYAWAAMLPTTVSKDQVANVPTPGFIGPENYQTDKAEVVHAGAVLRSGEFSVAWQDNFARAEVTNLTDTDWFPGDTVFITVAGKTFDPTDIQESFANLEARVTANEAAILDLQTRVAKLEAKPGGGPPGATQTPAEPTPAPTPTEPEPETGAEEEPQAETHKTGHKTAHKDEPKHR